MEWADVTAAAPNLRRNSRPITPALSILEGTANAGIIPFKNFSTMLVNGTLANISIMVRTWSAAAVLAVCLFAFPQSGAAQPQTMVLVNGHFDVARQSPIASVVYQKPVSEKIFVNGFVETWWNTDIGLPAEQWTVFSKNWVSYALTPRFSTSVEVELLFNRPGVAIKFPEEMMFQEQKAYIIPKIGFSYRVK